MKRLVNRLSGACLYVLLALIVGMSSCEDDANDWTVNKNYDALFRPLTFDKSATDATSVTLRYSQIVNAKVYILSFIRTAWSLMRKLCKDRYDSERYIDCIFRE